MLDVIPALLLVAAVTAALWFIQRRLFGSSRSRLRAALRLTAVALIALVAVGYGLMQLVNVRSFQLLGDSVVRVETGQKVVALTFDDGPQPGHTEDVIRILDEHDAKATFYVTGRECEAEPAELRALVRAEHEIGNHTWSHPRLLAMSQGAIADEIEKTDQLIRQAGYRGPISVRPPHAKRFVAACYYLWRHRRTAVMWDLEPDSIDAISGDPDAMVSYVRDGVRPGSILLMHVMYGSREASREALPHILDALEARGYRFVTVSQLLALRGS